MADKKSEENTYVDIKKNANFSPTADLVIQNLRDSWESLKENSLLKRDISRGTI